MVKKILSISQYCTYVTEIPMICEQVTLSLIQVSDNLIEVSKDSLAKR